MIKPVDRKKYTASANVVKVLTDAAHKDLSDAISCCYVGLDSDRAEYLEACCEEFLNSLKSKVTLAMSIACISSKSVPESPHGEGLGLPEVYRDSRDTEED